MLEVMAAVEAAEDAAIDNMVGEEDVVVETAEEEDVEINRGIRIRFNSQINNVMIRRSTAGHMVHVHIGVISAEILRQGINGWPRSRIRWAAPLTIAQMLVTNATALDN